MLPRLGQAILAAYLILLHVLVVVLVLKTDFLPNLLKTAGYVPLRPEWDHIDAEILVDQLRLDRSVGTGAALLFGDSIMAGVSAGVAGPDVVNFGIGGDTTRILAARLPLYDSVAQSRAVVLEVGVNDLKYRPIPDAIGLYAAILDRLRDRPRVVAVSMLPLDESTTVVRHRLDLRNAAARTFNHALRGICEGRPNCRYLDVWPAMLDPATGGLRAGYHLGDGWHLSDAGGQEMGRLVAEALRKP